MSGSLDGAGSPGAPLTHPVLDLSRKPVRGPLVELRGAHAGGGGDGGTHDLAGAPAGRAGPTPPPPLIGPSALVLIRPGCAGFLRPRTSCTRPAAPTPAPAERRIPRSPEGKLRKGGAGAFDCQGVARLPSPCWGPNKWLSHPFLVSVSLSAVMADRELLDGTLIPLVHE